MMVFHSLTFFIILKKTTLVFRTTNTMTFSTDGSLHFPSWRTSFYSEHGLLFLFWWIHVSYIDPYRLRKSILFLVKRAKCCWEDLVRKRFRFAALIFRKEITRSKLNRLVLLMFLQYQNFAQLHTTFFQNRIESKNIAIAAFTATYNL